MQKRSSSHSDKLYRKPDAADSGRFVLTDRREDNESSRDDATLVRLFCLWVFLQCFEYTAVPSLEWNLGITASPDRVVLFILLLAYARRGNHSSRVSRPATIAARMLELFMLLFAVIGTASWFAAGVDAEGQKFYYLTRLFNLSFLPAAAYFIGRRLQYTRTMLKEIRLFLAALGVYLGVTSVSEHFGLNALVFPKYILDPKLGIQFGRSRGPFLDTIGNGGMLLVSFLFLAYLSSSLQGLKRAVTFLLLLLMVLAIYFTDTRAIWLGLAAITAILLTLRTTMRKTAAMIACVTLCGFLSGAGSKFSAYQETLFSRRQNTVDYRLENYQITWRMFEKNPVFGIGFGRFREEWSNYFDKVDARTRDLVDGNHTTLLGILAELGIVGFAAYVAILACLGIICVTAYRRLDEDSWAFERGFVVIASGAFTSLFVLGLTNDLRSTGIVSVCAFWLVGIASSMHCSYLASKSARSLRPTQRVPVLKRVGRGSVFST